MKTNALFAIAIFACGFIRGETSQQRTHLTPEAFESRKAAEQYAAKLFAGGSVEMLRPRNSEILVLQVYGSGVPDIAIAAYRFTGGKWHRAAEIGFAAAESHRAMARDGAIIVISDKSANESVLLSADETEANQTPEPTSTAVMSDASASATPSAPVAHL